MIILMLVFAILRAHAGPVSAGPATDPTIAHTYVYGVQPRAEGSEPSMRTLYDVAKSCLITIAACVYRAIHQNIPDPSLTFWGRLRVRVKITFYALIAPELMIFWAMRQRFGAREGMMHLDKHIPGLKWTQTHGQFIQMGGFVRHDTKHVLLHSDIAKLFEEGRLELNELVQITREDINDKSKGDILSKSLVAFQTTWFVFECLARLQQGLPLLELEVVTLAFATLNIITYFLWWHKPLDVLRPIPLHIQPDPSEKADSLPSAEASPTEQEPEVVPLVNHAAEPLEEDVDDLGESEEGMLSHAMAAIGKTVDRMKKDCKKRPWYTTIWKRLIKQPFIAVVSPLGDLASDESLGEGKLGGVHIFFAIEIPDHSRTLTAMLSTCIGTIFGAIHFLSWNATFPTHTQRRLWRISSIILTAEPCFVAIIGVSLMLLAFCEGLIDSLPQPQWVRDLRKRLADVLATSQDIIDRLSRIPWVSYPCMCLALLFMIPFAVALCLSPLLYIIARFYIMVIAFFTLRDLPPNALNTISWTSYIPHI